ncbi:high mobility group protein B2-like [Styela clava]|uniref:high mobility group protein B2-like n=1 Tax=Styela clava TaxID=7725 RepID=UPI00193AB96F|nr:high mobility group protein B2-like [Styela clava]
MGKKDPNKPRGKMTAYAFFVQTCRQEHKKSHPDEQVVFAEFSRKCAERWKDMNTKEKKIFNDMAGRDKLRYDREMEGYCPPAGEGKKPQKRKKDPNAPKRPQSAFFLFCGDRRAEIKKENPSFTVGDIAKKLGKLWSEASKDIKEKYDDLGKLAKKQYEKDLKAYKDGQQQAGKAKKQKKEESSSSSSSSSSSGSDSDRDSD